MSEAPSLDNAPPKPAVTADGATLRQLEEEGVAEALAAVASKNAAVEEATAKLSVRELLDLKIKFKCAPARATEVTGETEVIVEAELWKLLQHSQVIADTVRTCADSITSEGVTIHAPGVPADAARTVLDVLLNKMTARMWHDIDKFKCEWKQKYIADDKVFAWTRTESCFDWVDKETYRFIDMFQFDALRGAVDAFVSKYPTMDTIAARDAVSPTDAEWASERELAKVAEFLFYDDPSEPRSATRFLVERYLRELSSALLARVMGHVAWDAVFKYSTHCVGQDHEVDLGRNYHESADIHPKLFVKKEWRAQLPEGGPKSSH